MQPVIQRFHSSLEKIDAFSAQSIPTLTALNGLWGETVSFQISCTFDPEYYDDYYSVLSLTCPECVTEVFIVEQAPCSFPCRQNATGAYLVRTPSLIPDILKPYHAEPVRLNSGLYQVFWVDVHIPQGAKSTDILAEFRDRKGNLQNQQKLHLEIVPVQLAEQRVRHTEWFYNDCLCQQYGCEMFSQEFFNIAGDYISCAAKHGVDTLLTPIFTPSLDIEPSCRRMPGQLVTITRTQQGLHYDFALFRRWVQMAQECGIAYFEIAPFFTQWGAKCAAEIYEQTPQGLKTLFSWDTPAISEAYADFLADFLPALITQLKQLGIKEKTYFHVSDEPSLEQLENYRAAREMIVPYLDGCPVIDALSSYEFYQQDLVSIPVVAEDHLEPFLNGKKTGEIWTYSCCSQDKLVPNVFLSMPSIRGRILGVLMYKENLNGFLRWGYNFWNSQFSKEAIDPYRVTDAGFGFPSGDAFLVYPGEDGTPVASIRLKVLRDAFQDHRALRTLEQKIGREEVLKWITEELGDISFTQYPVDNAAFLHFSQELYGRLGKYNESGDLK